METLLPEHTGTGQGPGPGPAQEPSIIALTVSVCVQGLIFVVDSNDRERVSESADELLKMVSQRQEVEPQSRADGRSGHSHSPGV